MPNFWDERYRVEDYVYGTAPNDFLREHAERIPAGRVLCLAEGEGRNAVFLAERGHRVTAVDLSIEGLRKAERLGKARGLPGGALELVHADLADYVPEEGAFAAVASIFAHVPRPTRARIHGLVPRALVPGGVLILEAYTPAQLRFGTGGPKDPALMPTLAELREELAAPDPELDLEIAREVERDVVEGAFHTGRAATVQVLGVRR